MFQTTNQNIIVVASNWAIKNTPSSHPIMDDRFPYYGYDSIH